MTPNSTNPAARYCMPLRVSPNKAQPKNKVPSGSRFIKLPTWLAGIVLNAKL